MGLCRGLFITGTNTGVGKTHVGAIIARALVAAGHRVGVYKPAESGCRSEGGELVAADAQHLWEAARRPGELSRVCPQRFAAPLAPPQAAAAEGKQVDRERLRTGIEYWLDQSDIVLVEGAGGLMSPLSNADYNADLAVDLGLPLLIVSSNELGTINATLQTVITAGVVAPKLPIAGIMLSQTAPREDDPSVKTNAADIRTRCDAPLLATVAFGQQELAKEVDWATLARSRKT